MGGQGKQEGKWTSKLMSLSQSPCEFLSYMQLFSMFVSLSRTLIRQTGTSRESYICAQSCILLMGWTLYKSTLRGRSFLNPSSPSNPISPHKADAGSLGSLMEKCQRAQKAGTRGFSGKTLR